jgi:F-type H+-transporting ATPase subunit b
MAQSVAVKTANLALAMSVSVGSAFAAEEESGLPQLDFTTWPTQVFWLVVTFALAYLLMWRVVTPRIASVLEERRARLDDDMQRAKHAADEADAMRVSLEKKLADARAEAQEEMRSTLAAAAAEAEKKNAATAERLTKKVSEAEAKITEGRNAAMKDLDDVAATSVIDATSSLAGIKVTMADAKKAVAAAAKANPAMEQN